MENKSTIFGIIALIIGGAGLGLGVFSVISFQGIEGLQGPSGEDGIDGTDGIDGIDGTDGINGTDGKDAPGIYCNSASEVQQVLDSIGTGSDTIIINETITLTKSLDIDVFRGDEDNVLERFYTIAKENQARHIIRLTGDNPLIDFTALAFLLEKHHNGSCDYSCMTGLPTGALGDIFSFKALEMSYKNADGKELCDHVDLYVLENQNKFKIVCYDLIHDLSSYRWTIDEQQDMNRIKSFFLSVKENTSNRIEELNTKQLLDLIQSLGFQENMQPLQANISTKNIYTAELVKKINRHIPVNLEEIFS